MSHTFAIHVPDELSLPAVLALNIDLERPFGELPIETRCLIFALHQAGKIDVTCEGLTFPIPGFHPTDRYQIRRKEAPLVPDSIDWSHVSPEWKFMARDMDGKVYLYTDAPKLGATDMWTLSTPRGLHLGGRAFVSYKRGTVDWKDSLVVRPE